MLHPLPVWLCTGLDMQYDELVEQITRLVIMEVEKASGTAGGTQSPPGERALLLVDPEMDDFTSLFDHLSRNNKPATGYIIVLPAELLDRARTDAGLFSFEAVTDPPRSAYKNLIKGVSRVIIPHLSVTALNKMANLMGDEPVAGIAVTALLEGIPVVVCDDNIIGLNFSDSTPSRKIMAVIRRSMEVLREMGVSTVSLGSLKSEKPVTARTLTPAGRRIVVTNDDIFTASDQSRKVLNFPRGTIVTPLAWDTAESLGIDIRLV